VNIQAATLLLTLPLASLACGANTLDLGGAAIESSSEPGVLAVVHEQVEKIAVDDERLYWSGSRLARNEGRNILFLHSCQKRNCASTLVTYDAQPFDLDHVFSVSGGEIHWFRWTPTEQTLCPSGGCRGELLACPVAGCNGSPRTLASDLTFTAATFDDDRFYFADSMALYSVPLSQPGPRQLVAASLGMIRAVAIHDAYAYWRVDGLANGGQSLLVRGRKDGASTAETIANDLRCSANHDFSVTTDATSIYWTNNLLVGSINRCPLGGCSDASDAVIAPLRVPQKLQIDGSELYYQYEPRPYEYALASCTLPNCAEILPIIERVDAPGVLAMDDDYLYVATTEQDVSPDNLSENTVARIRLLPKPHREVP
jgi:hypothetical protein